MAALEAHKAAPEFQKLASHAKEWFAEPLILDLLEPSKL
jgi:quinol monooxygenase YgiN